jgi:hypothetical protein
VVRIPIEPVGTVRFVTEGKLRDDFIVSIRRAETREYVGNGRGEIPLLPGTYEFELATTPRQTRVVTVVSGQVVEVAVGGVTTVRAVTAGQVREELPITARDFQTNQVVGNGRRGTVQITGGTYKFDVLTEPYNTLVELTVEDGRSYDLEIPQYGTLRILDGAGQPISATVTFRNPETKAAYRSLRPTNGEVSVLPGAYILDVNIGGKRSEVNANVESGKTIDVIIPLRLIVVSCGGMARHAPTGVLGRISARR